MSISLIDFSNLSPKEKKKALEEMKKEIGVSGIVQEWNVSRSKVYNLLHEFDIPVNTKKRTLKPRKPKQNPENITASNQSGSSEPIREVKSSLTSDDGSKFSLYLETQGSARFINETLQNILSTHNLNNSRLQINISVQEI